jgi:metal-responsive CopG/Arc/MetJ family transcriptional regulator
MGTITLSLPEKLKQTMDCVDWINWSSVARRAFVETLKDIRELELIKKAREVSGISDNDKRELKNSVVELVVKSSDETYNKFKSGKIKSMSLDELDELLNLK